MKVVIVIPVYRNPAPEEIVSLERCCLILNRYDHCLVCPEDMDLSEFYAIWGRHNLSFAIKRYDKSFFEGVAGYNKLCLSRFFYDGFESYDYMLIYQADAYVFRDELDAWCEKGFDYVGAPVFTSLEELCTQQNLIYNGGFSLRRVAFFRSFFSRKFVYPHKYLWSDLTSSGISFHALIAYVIRVIGYHNTPCSVVRSWLNKGLNEDQFWSKELMSSNFRPCVPTVSEAMSFSVEKYSSAVFKLRQQLPMGCHAWGKYEYETFWSEFIP